MTREDIIRAWKDPFYRESLTAHERAGMPEHPAGAIELSDPELDLVSGGFGIATTDWLCKTVTSSLRLLTKYECCSLTATGTKYCTKKPTCEVAGAR